MATDDMMFELSPVNHISVMKILETIQNLSCVCRHLGISKMVLLVQICKGALSYKLEKDVKFRFILQIWFCKNYYKRLTEEN